MRTPDDNEGWQEMLDMQTHLGLSDLWREANGDVFFHTHRTAVQGGHTLTRIDFVLAMAHLIPLLAHGAWPQHMTMCFGRALAGLTM